MAVTAKDIVFGPFNDQLLGRSVGLNLLVSDEGVCQHDCAYCNLNVAKAKTTARNPEPYEVVESLIEFLQLKDGSDAKLNSIVITGGGNPIEHPKFTDIVKDVLLVRDLVSPETEVIVVTSGKGIEMPQTLLALQKVDLCILRYDPTTTASLKNEAGVKLKAQLKKLKGNLAVQACLEKQQVRHDEERSFQTWLDDMVFIGPRHAYLCAADKDKRDSEIPFFPQKQLAHVHQLLEAHNIRTHIL